MESNTISYMEYKSQIDEYWQDQVFAGAMFGRANLREVSLAFLNITDRIEQDTEINQEYKNELLGIIMKKVELLKAREEEILKAEADITTEKAEARVKATKRFEKLPYRQREKYSALKSMIDKGFWQFLTIEDMDELFKGETGYSEMKSRLEEKFPTIAKEFIPEIEKTEKEIEEERTEK